MTVVIDDKLLGEIGKGGKEFSRFEAMVYIMASEGEISLRNISKKTGWTRWKIQKILEEMEAMGVLTVEQNGNKTAITCQKLATRPATKKQTGSGSKVKNLPPGQPLSNHPDLTDEDLKVWVGYEGWLKKFTPRVQQLPKPLDAVAIKKLRDKYPKEVIKDVLMAMQNHKELHKKYVDAYLTANNWCDRRLKNQPVDDNAKDKDSYSAQFHKS